MFANLIMSLGAVLLLSAGAAFAEPDDAPAERHHNENPISEMDADKNGVISFEESNAHAGKKFDEIDADKDGVVSTTEMDKYREAQKTAREQAAKKKYHEKIDPDGDEMITREEFVKRAVDGHQKMDADKDGNVTKEEVKAAHEKRREAREGMREKREQRRLEGRQSKAKIKVEPAPVAPPAAPPVEVKPEAAPTAE